MNEGGNGEGTNGGGNTVSLLGAQNGSGNGGGNEEGNSGGNGGETSEEDYSAEGIAKRKAAIIAAISKNVPGLELTPDKLVPISV